MSNFAQLQNMLYGSLLSSVSVEYERDGETKVAEIMSGFSIPSVKTNIYGNVGYIKISGFYKNTASEFKAAIEKLMADGAESLVFDVRDVSSGTIDYSAQVIDVIVPAISDNIAVAKDKDGNVYKNKTKTERRIYMKKLLYICLSYVIRFESDIVDKISLCISYGYS